MQLYALDSEDRPIIAKLAAKGKDYVCPECRSPVRVRAGSHRQPHFFHLTSSRNCRQNGKSLTHLQVQNTLFEMLPPGEAQLECRFSSINRIADLAWISQRIVFEVQCSPITAEEVAARNRDYLSEGFQPVWILHDRRFKRRRAAAAEAYLMNSPCYFTNIDAGGQGIIYDQCAPIVKGYRRIFSTQHRVDLSKPAPIPHAHTPYTYLKRRVENWPLCFQGDLIDTFHRKPSACSFLEKAEPIKESKAKLQLLERYIIQPYQSIFQYILKSLAL